MQLAQWAVYTYKIIHISYTSLMHKIIICWEFEKVKCGIGNPNGNANKDLGRQ
jgi:hypothetical protein